MPAIRIEMIVDKGSTGADVTDFANAITSSVSAASTRIESEVRASSTRMVDEMRRGFQGAITPLVGVMDKLLSMVNQFGPGFAKAGSAASGMARELNAAASAGEKLERAMNAARSVKLDDVFRNFGGSPTGKSTINFDADGNIRKLVQEYVQGLSTANVARAGGEDGPITGLQIRTRASAQEQASGSSDMDRLSRQVQERFTQDMLERQKQLFDQLERSGNTSSGADEMARLSRQLEERHRDRVLEQQSELYKQLEKEATVGSFGQRVAQLKQQGFIANRTSYGPDGNATSQTLSRKAGIFSNAETAHLNFDTHEATRQVQEFSSLYGRTMQGLSHPITSLGSVFDSLGSKIRGVGRTMIYLSATFYSLRRIGEGMREIFLGPIEAIVNATTKAREFQSSISGVVGGGANAAAIDQSIIANLNSLPFSLEVARGIMLDIAKIPAFAGSLAGKTPAEVASFGSRYENTLAGLQVLNPQADPSAIAHGIEGALLGQGRALRTLVQIDPDQLAQMVGLNKGTEFRGRPEQLLSALDKYTQIMAPGNSVEQRNALPEVQIQHIKDQFSVAFSQIGDAHIFDRIVEEAKQAAETLATYFSPNNAEWMQHAESIGTSLTHIFDNVVNAMLRGLSSLAGVDKVEKTPEGIADGIDLMFQRLAGASDALPAVASGIGTALHSLVSSLGEFMGWIQEQAQIFANKGHIPSALEAAQIEAGRPAAVDALLESHGISLRQKVGETTLADAFKANISGRPTPNVDSSIWEINGFDQLDLMSFPGYSGGNTKTPVYGQQSAEDKILSARVNDALSGKLLGPGAQSFTDPAGAWKILEQSGIVDAMGKLGHAAKEASDPLSELGKAVSHSGVASHAMSTLSIAQGASADLRNLALNSPQLEALAGGKFDKVDKVGELRDQAFAELRYAIDNGLLKSPDDATISGMNKTVAGYEAAGHRAIAEGKTEEGQALLKEASTQSSLAKLAMDRMQDINQAISAYGINIAAAIGRDSYSLKARYYQQAISGTSDLAVDAGKAEGLTPAQQKSKFGIAGLPDDLQVPTINNATEAQLAYIKEMDFSGTTASVDRLGQEMEALHTAMGQVAEVQSRLASQGKQDSDAWIEASEAASKYSAQLSKLLDQQEKARASQIKTMGGYGLQADFVSTLNRGTSIGQLMNSVGGPLPEHDSVLSGLFGRSSLDQQDIGMNRQLLRQASANYGRAQADLLANPGDRNAQQAFDSAAEQVVRFTAALDQAAQHANQFLQGAVQFLNKVQGDLEHGIGELFGNALGGGGRDASRRATLIMENMGKQIVGNFAQTTTHTLFESVLGTPNGKAGAGNGLGGLLEQFIGGGKSGSAMSTAMMTVNANMVNILGGGAGGIPSSGGSGGGGGGGLIGGILGLFGGAGGSAGASAGADAGVAMAMAAAQGTVFSGGWTPFHAFASGGVVRGGRGGMLGWVGEAGHDEAVVPMHNGGIPLGMRGGSIVATLPGGRHIPTTGFADGGIAAGGFSAFNGINTGGLPSSRPGPGSGGDSGPGGGDINLTTQVMLDGKVIASHTAKHTRAQVKAETMKMLGPGGHGRAALNKS